MNRRSLLASVHIARKAALMCTLCNRLFFGQSCPDCGAHGRPLADWEYRQFVGAVTGEDSCSHADENDLRKVMDLFNRAGFREAFPYVSPHQEAWKARQGTMAQIHRRARQVFGPSAEERVQGFLEKVIGKQELKFCDVVELRRVIGWINRTARYQSERRET
jgi:hypothetical protein